MKLFKQYNCKVFEFYSEILFSLTHFPLVFFYSSVMSPLDRFIGFPIFRL